MVLLTLPTKLSSYFSSVSTNKYCVENFESQSSFGIVVALFTALKYDEYPVTAGYTLIKSNKFVHSAR